MWYYIENKSQLPNIVGNYLMSATSSQHLGGLVGVKRPGVQVTSKVLEDAKELVKGMTDTAAGASFVEQLLSLGVKVQISYFEAEPRACAY
ncbi:uncharacterized protein N0V89_006354 [Didymosphaeria variabile]|uniref:Uncharacterized protein n=1 Tax=Didymosphaeria variabile TaxID=1932322 RepID=A0A9W8XQ81_9PLEO|nr:uncharacterized protein N0V89_006354 [Didymosphaeria variabile]KAJ4354617.1 hypothetical protein N0V89_006354 [Didymosphaeria variabile]